MGMKQWFEAADGWGLRDDLLAALRSSSTRIICRGAKSTSAVRQAGLDVAWRAPSESMAEVIDHLRSTGPPVASDTVAVQLFDPDDHPATAELRSLAGAVVEVPVYRWLLPTDLAPAERLVRAAVAGDLGAITFTSQPAVRFLFTIADRLGLRDDLVRRRQRRHGATRLHRPRLRRSGRGDRSHDDGVARAVPAPADGPPRGRAPRRRRGSEVPDPLP